ncbi:MAG: glycosyltransferase, partial [Patescibacteria group bacterium]
TAINEYGKDFLILTVARIEPEKNLFLAIDVVAEVLRQYPETRYTIIGQGSLLDRLIIKIKSLSVGDRITIKQVNINDLPSWYKRANLFLLTSNYEGYSMAIIESAAAGIPVVTTDVGVALGEVLPVKNKSRLVEVTNGLVSNPEKCKELIEKQNEFFKNWPTKERWLAAIKDSWEQCSNE